MEALLGGRLFLAALEVAGFYSGEVSFELGVFFSIAGCELSFAVFFDLRFVAFREVPTTKATVGADEGEFGLFEIFAKVLDEVNEVFFVGVYRVVIDSIVPSLVPTEATEFEAFPIVVRIVFFEIGSDLLHMTKDFGVVESLVAIFLRLGIFLDAWWEEVVVERPPAP